MKIYLDSCSLQRPLDNQNQIRIATESEAILGILSLWESKEVELVGSEVLNYEAKKITQPERLTYMMELLSRIELFVELKDSIEIRAAFFVEKGIKPLDALHLASAEDSLADFMCTCDDKFLKKCLTLKNLKTTAISPLDLIKIL